MLIGLLLHGLLHKVCRQALGEARPRSEALDALVIGIL
jgi:hypothetical protein